jgi:hypothetical protein
MVSLCLAFASSSLCVVSLAFWYDSYPIPTQQGQMQKVLSLQPLKQSHLIFQVYEEQF